MLQVFRKKCRDGRYGSSLTRTIYIRATARISDRQTLRPFTLVLLHLPPPLPTSCYTLPHVSVYASSESSSDDCDFGLSICTMCSLCLARCIRIDLHFLHHPPTPCCGDDMLSIPEGWPARYGLAMEILASTRLTPTYEHCGMLPFVQQQAHRILMGDAPVALNLRAAVTMMSRG